MQSDPTCFIVTSHGWSGTFWLAYSLNLHPEMTVSHCAENLLACQSDLHSPDRHRKHVRELHHGMIARQNKRLDDTYDEIFRMGESPVYGSVHAYRLRDLPVQAQKFGAFRRNYTLANLVRHPVTFTWSGYGHLQEMFTYDIFVLRGILNLVLSAEEFIFRLADRHDLNLASFEVAAFLGAAANMHNLAQDVKVGREVNHIRMETVTQDPDLFRKVVDFLTRGKVRADDGYLGQVFSAGELNKHQKGGKLSPKERYESWMPWQQEAFRFFLETSGIRPAYESLGYDLSFVR